MTKLKRKPKAERGFGHFFARLLPIAFALFIEIFAFDSLSDPLGFLIHSIPSIIVLAVVFLSWKNPRRGAWGFLALGTIFTLLFRTWKSPFSLLLISGPLFLVSVLYFAEARKGNVP